MQNVVRVAISGKSGCGNSTVSRLVADSLGFTMVNYTFHSIANERGMEFNELRRLAEKDQSWDLYLDRRQLEMARSAGNCVLGSRLAVWLLDDAHLKVYLTAPLEVRAARIRTREGGKLEAVIADTMSRDRADHERYLRLYGIDSDHYDFVDLIINTEHLKQDEVAQVITRTVRDLPAFRALTGG